MNVLICDDDKYVRKMLEKITSEIISINNIFLAEDGLEAVKIAGDEKIDIALLDIDMPNLDGLEAAKIISKTQPNAKFVFITAYVEYAVDSFCVHPYDYILKPIDICKFKEVLNELQSMVSKITQITNDESKKLTIKTGNQIYIICLDDIFYVEKLKKEVIVYTLNSSFNLNKSLAELEKKYLDSNFIRTHQSFIVNKTKIEKINVIGNKSYEIEFNGISTKAILSRHKYSQVLKDLSS